MELPEEVIFTLNKPVKYAHKGEEIDGNFITLYPPTLNQLRQRSLLKQAFFQAINEIQTGKETSGENDSKIAGKDVINLFYASKCDIVKVIIDGMDLLKSGVAKIEGVKPLTDPLLKKMKYEDIENCIGEYIANFIIASVME